MLLSEIFDQLQYGEFSQLKIGEFGESEKKQIILFLNSALLELYKRFVLRLNTISIYKIPGIVIYKCSKEYSIRDIQQIDRYRYLLDYTDRPFQDEDLIKIERIFNECGELQPLNDDKNRDSFYTPSFNILQFPPLYSDRLAIVEYRAKHPQISVDAESSCTEIDISPIFLEPLLLLMAHRVSRILNSDQHQESNNYLQQYEAACLQIEKAGLLFDTNSTNMKLDINGWV